MWVAFAAANPRTDAVRTCSPMVDGVQRVTARPCASVMTRAAARIPVFAANVTGASGTRITPGAKVPSDAEWERSVREFREQVLELQQRIRIYNLKAPAAVFHRKHIYVEKILESIKRNEAG